MMKTTNHRFHSPKHLLKILIRVKGNKKDFRLRDSYEDDDNSFYIDLHDEYINEDIENLEIKLLEIKQKIKQKMIKYP